MKIRSALSLAVASLVMCSVAMAITPAPQFPGAKNLETSDPMKLAIDAAKQQLAQQAGDKAKVDAFTLPAGTTFENVAEFYSSKLSGWEEKLKTAQPTGGTAAWANGTNEILSISYMSNMIDPSGAPYLIVAQGEGVPN